MSKALGAGEECENLSRDLCLSGVQGSSEQQTEAHEWYVEGATHLLEVQEEQGSWNLTRNRTTDTCFAILFLKRATKRLVASTGK